MFHDSDFAPFEPPKRRTTSVTFLGNPIQILPRSTYQEGFTRLPAPWPLAEALFATDPGLIEDLLITRSDLFGHACILRQEMPALYDARGLFLSEGDDWRWQHRAVAPAFRHETLLGFVPSFAAAAERQIECWRARLVFVLFRLSGVGTRTITRVIVENANCSPFAHGSLHFTELPAAQRMTARCPNDTPLLCRDG